MKIFTKQFVISSLCLIFVSVFVFNFAMAGKPEKPGQKDLESPTVSIAFPQNGGIISGIVTVKADANDNVGVTKVEFYINGNKEFTDEADPYKFLWNTTSFPDGDYMLMVKAYDKARNEGVSSPITIIVENGLNVALQIQAELDYIVNSSWTEENKNSKGWRFFQSTDDIYGAINSNRIPFHGAPNRFGWVRPGESAMAMVGMMQGVSYLDSQGIDIIKYNIVIDKFFSDWELSHGQGQNHDSLSLDYGAFMDRVDYDSSGNYAIANPNWKTDVTAQMMIANWKYYEYKFNTGQIEDADGWISEAWSIQNEAANYLVNMYDSISVGETNLLPGNSSEEERGTWIHFAANAVPALHSASAWAKKMSVSYADYDRVADNLLLGIETMKDPNRPGYFKYRPYLGDDQYGDPTYGDSIDQLTFSPYETGAVSPDDFAKQISDWWTDGAGDVKMTYETENSSDWRYFGTHWHYYFNDSPENNYIYPGPGFQLAKVEWKYGKSSSDPDNVYLIRSLNRLNWAKSLEYSSLWWFLTGEEEAKVPNGFMDWRNATNYSDTAESWARFVDTSAYFIEVLLMHEADIDTTYNPIMS